MDLISFQSRPDGSVGVVPRPQPVGETWAVEIERNGSGKYAPPGAMSREDAVAIVERNHALGLRDAGVPVRVRVFADGRTEVIEIARP
jgi:hypothetical protein